MRLGMVVFDDELSPTQLRNTEKELEVRSSTEQI